MVALGKSAGFYFIYHTDIMKMYRNIGIRNSNSIWFKKANFL